MPRYILLLNWTDQGAKNVKDSVSRAAAARQLFEKSGARLADAAWTLGPYDLVLTVEAPDDETLIASNLALARLGNVRTTTLRAFTESEMQRIVQKL
jgi:uncharacterized protein with GYD domain